MRESLHKCGDFLFKPLLVSEANDMKIFLIVVGIIVAIILIIIIILYITTVERFEFRIVKYAKSSDTIKYRIEQIHGIGIFRHWHNLYDSCCVYEDYNYTPRFRYNNLISKNSILEDGYRTPERADEVIKEVIEIIKSDNTIKEYKC